MRLAASVLAIVVSAAHIQWAGREVSAQSARSPETPPQADRGTIAVLRRDGLMLPFASFRGTTWVVAWPQNLGMLELPINVPSIPERWWGGWTPNAWEAWLIAGTTRQLTPLAPRLVRVHCEERIGLRTDHRPAQPPPLPPVEPYPKDGIAVTSGVRVEPITAVRSTSLEWTALAVSLLEEFDRAEDREISTISSIWRHPVKRDERRQLPVRLENWYRTMLDDGTAVSYIEAARIYTPRPEDDECGLETFFTGWVIQGKASEKPRTQLGARVTYCDRVGASYMLPFGRVRLHDRVYWLAQIAGNESEWYTVAQVSSDRVRYVAEYFAGGRDSCR